MFKYKAPVIGMVMLVGGLLAINATLQGHQQGGATIKMKLLLPEGPYDNWKESKLTVDGKEVKAEGDGEVRTLTATTGKDKDYVVVAFDYSPNNYTQIVRSRKVVAKDGVVEVDMRTPSAKERDDVKVRWVATPKDVSEEMCRMAKVGKDDVVYDLGCGDGIMVLTAVKEFGAKKGVGIDLDAEGKELIKKCKETAKEMGISDKVEFRQGNVLEVKDLSDATVVLLYMGDDINALLKPILQKTLKPGARVVSHRFIMGDDWKPEVTKSFYSKEWDGNVELHMWTIPKK
jgi:SAM-dependent methyltransferase